MSDPWRCIPGTHRVRGRGPHVSSLLSVYRLSSSDNPFRAINDVYRPKHSHGRSSASPTCLARHALSQRAAGPADTAIALMGAAASQQEARQRYDTVASHTRAAGATSVRSRYSCRPWKPNFRCPSGNLYMAIRPQARRPAVRARTSLGGPPEQPPTCRD